jgi:spoIIIJ-associated protein
MSDVLNRAATVTKKILALMGVQPTSVSSDQTDEGVAVTIRLPDDESGLLIGYHGETLSALQYLAGQIVNRGEATWTRVTVNINDYRNQRDQQLQQMAQNAADRAVSTGDEIEMPYLTPAERRVIHLALADRDDVTTFSEGEDPRTTPSSNRFCWTVNQ